MKRKVQKIKTKTAPSNPPEKRDSKIIHPPKVVIEKPVKLADVPMHAASGDDDRMSDPQSNRPIPAVGEV